MNNKAGNAKKYGEESYNKCRHAPKTIKLSNECSGVDVADIGDFDEDDLGHTPNGEALASAGRSSALSAGRVV